MAINVGDNTLKTMKSAVDGAGLLNEANRFVMELFDLQYRNIFEILIYPASFTSSFSVLNVGSALLDSIVTRLHLQSLSIPFKKIEYDTADLVYYVKNLTKPAECTLSFIDNELGIVRNYLDYWHSEIIIDDPVFGYRFRDDQLKAKKNAIIIPQMGSALPSTGWIKLEGLKYSGQADITFGHAESDPLVMDVNCSVDNVYWMTAQDLIF